MTAQLWQGDVLAVLRSLPDGVARCCVTSPPYWGLRDYGVSGQLGLEPTPDAYTAKMVEVFREVRRVLTDDGTLWLNLGDSYSSGGRSTQVAPTLRMRGHDAASGKQEYLNNFAVRPGTPEGTKPKDLIGIPWRVAFALQADGWYLRSDIIWAKPNPMPESVTDRPTKSHEYLFLLSKRERYYYDAVAIAEKSIDPESLNGRNTRNADKFVEHDAGGMARTRAGFAAIQAGRLYLTRNARSVWTIATQSFSGAHFATFPEELARRCIVAGSAPGDTVLDPFGGSGTVAAVAVGNGREAIYIDLNPAYLELARNRIGPAFCEMAS